MASQPGQQIITIHILPNVSRSKGSHTLEFGQVIEFSKRNILLRKPCRKWDREIGSRPPFVFLKKLCMR